MSGGFVAMMILAERTFHFFVYIFFVKTASSTFSNSRCRPAASARSPSSTTLLKRIKLMFAQMISHTIYKYLMSNLLYLLLYVSDTCFLGEPYETVWHKPGGVKKCVCLYVRYIFLERAHSARMPGSKETLREDGNGTLCPVR